MRPLGECLYWIVGMLVLALMGALYYLSYPPEWLYFAIKRRTLRPKLWR